MRTSRNYPSHRKGVAYRTENTSHCIPVIGKTTTFTTALRIFTSSPVPQCIYIYQWFTALKENLSVTENCYSFAEIANYLFHSLSAEGIKIEWVRSSALMTLLQFTWDILGTKNAVHAPPILWKLVYFLFLITRWGNSFIYVHDSLAGVACAKLIWPAH